jgi:hypothetical protein
MLRGYSRALNGYTVKEIFSTKLRGEPFDVLRDGLAKEMDWLIEREIFGRPHYNSYVCHYPIRIWYKVGKPPYAQLNRDWLNPGDIWTF